MPRVDLEMEPQDPRTAPPRPSEGRFLVAKFRPTGRFEDDENRPFKVAGRPGGSINISNILSPVICISYAERACIFLYFVFSLIPYSQNHGLCP
jgi:hypothetical protein